MPKTEITRTYVFEQGRMYKHSGSPIISGPQSVLRYIPHSWRNKPQEHFYTILLDARHRVIKKVVVSKGTLNASLVHPRDVFREAVKANAMAIVCIHNHPSGDTNPSREDIMLTSRLDEAGRLMGISLLDHLIITELDYLSFREYGWPGRDEHEEVEDVQ